MGGSHVFNSSTESVCRGVSVERFFAEPKVCEHHVSLAIQHYVLRLQVSAREGREREERERVYLGVIQSFQVLRDPDTK